MENRSWIYQAWTIVKIELRRAFFSKRAFWVYALALIPAIIFFAHGVQLKVRRQRLSAAGFAQPALLDGIREGETPEAIIQRAGKPAWDRAWERHRRVSPSGKNKGITTHSIEPAAEARYVRLNVRVPSYSGDPAARIYEFEVYGEKESVNMALNRPATSSPPCSASGNDSRSMPRRSAGSFS